MIFNSKTPNGHFSVLQNFFLKMVKTPLKRWVSLKWVSKCSIALLWVLITGAPIGCGTDKETIIQKKVAERVAEFRTKKRQECTTALLADAEKIVDSLLLDEAKQQLNDSLMRTRPSRPVQPADIPAIDSSAVAPIVRPASSTRRQ
jgi:hypothetical protein